MHRHLPQLLSYLIEGSEDAAVGFIPGHRVIVPHRTSKTPHNRRVMAFQLREGDAEATAGKQVGGGVREALPVARGVRALRGRHPQRRRQVLRPRVVTEARAIATFAVMGGPRGAVHLPPGVLPRIHDYVMDCDTLQGNTSLGLGKWLINRQHMANDLSCCLCQCLRRFGLVWSYPHRGPPSREPSSVSSDAPHPRLATSQSESAINVLRCTLGHGSGAE